MTTTKNTKFELDTAEFQFAHMHKPQFSGLRFWTVELPETKIFAAKQVQFYSNCRKDFYQKVQQIINQWANDPRYTWTPGTTVSVKVCS